MTLRVSLDYRRITNLEVSNSNPTVECSFITCFNRVGIASVLVKSWSSLPLGPDHENVPCDPRSLDDMAFTLTRLHYPWIKRVS